MKFNFFHSYFLVLIVELRSEIAAAALQRIFCCCCCCDVVVLVYGLRLYGLKRLTESVSCRIVHALHFIFIRFPWFIGFVSKLHTHIHHHHPFFHGTRDSLPRICWTNSPKLTQRIIQNSKALWLSCTLTSLQPPKMVCCYSFVLLMVAVAAVMLYLSHISLKNIAEEPTHALSAILHFYVTECCCFSSPKAISTFITIST